MDEKIYTISRSNEHGALFEHVLFFCKLCSTFSMCFVRYLSSSYSYSLVLYSSASLSLSLSSSLHPWTEEEKTAPCTPNYITFFPLSVMCYYLLFFPLFLSLAMKNTRWVHLTFYFKNLKQNCSCAPPSPPKERNVVDEHLPTENSLCGRRITRSR